MLYVIFFLPHYFLKMPSFTCFLLQVLSWKMGSVNQSEPPCSDSIGEGPVLFIRYSLDKKVIAIQRSNHEVEFRNRETGDTFIQIYKPESENILGFFWTDCPTCDFVLIKTWCV